MNLFNTCSLSLSGRQQLHLAVWHCLLTHRPFIKRITVNCPESAYWTEKIRQEQSEDQLVEKVKPTVNVFMCMNSIVTVWRVCLLPAISVMLIPHLSLDPI